MATTPMPVASVEAVPAAPVVDAASTGGAQQQQPSAPMSLEAKLKAILHPAATPQTESIGGATQAADAQSSQAEPGQQTENSEQATADAQQQQLSDADPDDSDAPPPGLDIKDSRWKRIKGSSDWAKTLVSKLTGTEIRSITPDLLPPVDMLVENQKVAVAHQALLGNLNAGTPEGIRSAMEALYQAAPDGFVAMTQKLPEAVMQANPQAFPALAAHVFHLAQQQPQAYLAIAKPVVDNFLNGMKAAAMRSADPATKESLLNTYANAVWHATGGQVVVSVQDLMNGNGQQPNTEVDPRIEHERRALQAERQRLEAMRAEQERAAQDAVAKASEAWHGETADALWATAQEQAREALAPLKGTMTERQLNAIVSELAASAVEQMKNNAQFTIFEQARQADAQKRDPAMRQQVLTMARQMIAVPISSLRSEYLRQSTKSAVAASEQRHDQLRQAAAQTGPASSGSAPARNISTTPDLRSIPTLEGRLSKLLRG